MEKAQALGHTVEAVQVDGIPVFYCQTCGVHGSWQRRGLLDPCRGHPASTVAAKWLRCAMEGGLLLGKGAKPLPRRRFARRPNRQPRAPRPPTEASALRTRATATAQDELRWGTLALAKCHVDDPKPPEVKTSIAAVHAAVPPRTPEEDLVLLRPAPTDDDAEPEDCPNCAAAVLPSETQCAYCGLRRATGCPDQKAPTPEPPASSEPPARPRPRASGPERSPREGPAPDLPKPGLRSRRREAARGARVCFADAVEVIPVTSYKNDALWWPPAALGPKHASTSRSSCAHPASSGEPTSTPRAPEVAEAAPDAGGKPRKGRPPGSRNKAKPDNTAPLPTPEPAPLPTPDSERASPETSSAQARLAAMRARVRAK